MKKSKFFSMLFFLLLLIGLVLGFTPQSDINLRNYYKIINATSISVDNVTFNSLNDVKYVEDYSELLTAINNNDNNIVLLDGTYNISSTLKVPSGISIRGSNAKNVIFNCTGLNTCFSAIDNERIYEINIENIQFYSSDITGVGLDFTNISSSSFNNIMIRNFDKGLYGNGLNYYNDFYHLSITNSNYDIYLEGGSNANRFFGGSIKDSNTEILHLESSNEVNFYGISWEGTNQIINLSDSIAHSNGFFGNRFEFLTSGSINFASGSYGNSIIGGLKGGVTSINDNGDGNTILLGEGAKSFNTRNNAVTGVKISKTGSSMSDVFPTLELEEQYSSSGDPLNLKLINPRSTGDFIKGYDQSSNEKFSIDWYGNYLTSSGSITAVNLNGALDWTDLQNYPLSCPTDTYISQLGDTITCTGISDVYLSNTGDTATGVYTFNDNVYTLSQLGVGTNAPNSPLEIKANPAGSNSALRIEASGSTGLIAEIRHLINNVGSFHLYSSNVQKIILRADTGASYINTGGSFGVGTSSPVRTLQVRDVIRIESRNGAPSSPALGDIYVDATTSELCFYDGTSWVGLKSGGICT